MSELIFRVTPETDGSLKVQVDDNNFDPSMFYQAQYAMLQTSLACLAEYFYKLAVNANGGKLLSNEQIDQQFIPIIDKTISMAVGSALNQLNETINKANTCGCSNGCGCCGE